MATRDVPHDREAEESLLGAMMLSRVAVETSVARCVEADFYLPRHRLIFRAIVGLYETGQPVDVTTVAAQLDECEPNGLTKVGGRQTLTMVQAATPASANADAYADAVIDRASRRAVLAAAEAATAKAYDLTADIGDVIDDAAVSFGEAVRAGQERTHPHYAAWAPTVDMNEDWLVPNILERRDRVILVGSEGLGKLLSVDTPIPTPGGWRKMGEIQPGDMVFDGTGQPTEVVAVSEVDNTHTCYRLRFDDGAEIAAADTHLWRTVDYQGRQWSGSRERRQPRWNPGVRTTAEIAATLHARGGHTVNHAIECCEPLQYGHDLRLPVDPYVLGYWLGNGNCGTGVLTTGGADGVDDTDWVIGRIREAGYVATPTRVVHSDGSESLGHRVGVKGLMVPLRTLGVLHDKRIPERYLRASVHQRLMLLQGLLDSDGYVDPTSLGHGRGFGCAGVEWCATVPPGTANVFAADMMDLLHGLGIKPSAHVSDATLYGRTTSIRTRVTFQSKLPVFSLPRKAEPLIPPRTRRSHTRYIVAADPIDPVDCVCLQVAAPSSMYLVGEQCIPTHNSHVLRQWGLMCAAGVHWFTEQPIAPSTVLILDVENSPRQIVRNTQAMHRYASERAGDRYKAERFTIISFSAMDLTSRASRLSVEAYIAGHRPDLIVIGPLYKILPPPGRQLSFEEAALQGIHVFDDWRARYDCAILIEHHSPKGSSGRRDMDPLGSSAWLRWPEYGLSLIEDPDNTRVVKLDHFRGQREKRPWPTTLERGGISQWQWRAPDTYRAEETF